MILRMHKVTEFFSLFNAPITNTKPTRNISTEEFLDLLTGAGGRSYKDQVEQLRRMADKTKDERSQYKRSHLPYVTPHGTFEIRDNNSMIEASGLFVADLDFYGEDMSPFMEAIKSDPYVRLAFVGPSGAGSAKVFFRIDPIEILASASKQMGNVFGAVEGYLRKHYGHLFPPMEQGKTLLDQATKDLARACFLSYDSHAHLAPADGDRIDTDFIEEYFHREAPPSVETSPSRNVQPAVSSEQVGAPKLSLDGLAEKHLIAGGSHHAEVLKFVGAAMRFGHTKQAVHVFFMGGKWISPESGESSPDKLAETIEDAWTRYGNMDPDVVALKDGKIGFGVLSYSKNMNRGYQLDGLYHGGILGMLEKHGFCRRAVGQGFVFARKQNGVLEEMTDDKIKTFAQDQIKKIGDVTFNAWGQVHTTAEAIMEAFLKTSHTLFNDQWLVHLGLDNTPVLRDRGGAGFVPFSNGVVKVTREAITLQPWEDFAGAVVWKDQVISRELTLVDNFDECHFARFIINVAGGIEKRFDSMCSAIGYMLHHFNRPSEGQCVILNDEVITDINKPMGGSGKGVFVQAIMMLRKTAKVDGKHFDGGDRFRWQAVGPDTQVVWIDDVKKDFDFSLLHSNLTDGWTIERKHIPQVQIPGADSPKTIIASNSIIKGEGTTNKRRMFIIEIGDHYSKQIFTGLEKPIVDEHGGLFFTEDWPKDEWDKFFSFMLTCFQLYLEKGLIDFEGVNIERNKLRQRTSEEFAEWVDAQDFVTQKPYKTKVYFEGFRNIYFGDDPTFKQRTFTNHIKYFAESRKWIMKRQGREDFIFTDPSNAKPRASDVTPEGPPPPSDNIDTLEDAPF
jgi:hypothetical protein